MLEQPVEPWRWKRRVNYENNMDSKVVKKRCEG
jgi:hypothetical protein